MPSAAQLVSMVEAGRTFLLINLRLDVEVDADNEDIAEHVERAHTVEDHGIVEGDLLARLHHHQDDNQVGAGGRISVRPPAASDSSDNDAYICGFILDGLRDVGAVLGEGLDYEAHEVGEGRSLRRVV